MVCNIEGAKNLSPSYPFRPFFHASGMNRPVENASPQKNFNLGEVAHLPPCIVATGCNPDGMRFLCGHNVFYRASQTYGMR